MNFSHFYFRIHPDLQEFENEQDILFRALELYNGQYLVSWEDDDGFYTEIFYKNHEVIGSIASNQWILEKEK